MSAAVFLKHPSGREVQVQTGFSWPAFLFGPFWAIAKRQWILAALMGVGFVAVNVVAGMAQQAQDIVGLLVSLVLMIAYMVACGLYGNRWVRLLLEREGYRGEG
jgi:hypothetical protein